MRSTVQTIDYVVLVGYLCLMAGVGAYFMRYMRGGTARSSAASSA